MEKVNRPLVVPRMVREWAKQQGITIGDRGRIPAEVIDQYRQVKRASFRSA